MSVPSMNIPFGSASSGQSFRDAVASYRRSQYLVAGSTVSSASYEDDDLDVESQFSDVEEQLFDEDMEDDATTPSGFISQLEWDPIHDDPPSLPDAPRQTSGSSHSTAPVPVPSHILSSERTPLIKKRVSFSTGANRPVRPSIGQPKKTSSSTDLLAVPKSPVTLRRRLSGGSIKSPAPIHGGSTYGQSLFNSIAILLGIGMLSEPLAFSYAGWIGGTIIIFLYGGLTCYTAKILARMILEDPRLRSYSDIGRKAFGPRSTLFISGMFCLELFAVSVVLVTLYADSLHSIVPAFSSDAYKLIGLAIFVPTVYLPLSVLSYTSILGIVSTILLVVVILIDGISKRTSPGSFWEPAPTSLGIESPNALALSFGLFMAGFSGHAVIPSLARDMADPSQFDHMINRAFVVATCLYALIGAAGYIMFGNGVSEEVSMDLIRTPGFNKPLNQAALVLLVIMPLSKFALTTQPLNTTIQILLGLEPRIAAPEDVVGKPDSMSPLHPRTKFWKGVSVAQRAIVTLASVAVSIAVPEFSAMMAFLGSFSAFLLCVIGPVSAKIAMERKCGVVDGVILIFAIASALWGTFAAFVAGETEMP